MQCNASWSNSGRKFKKRQDYVRNEELIIKCSRENRMEWKSKEEHRMKMR